MRVGEAGVEAGAIYRLPADVIVVLRGIAVETFLHELNQSVISCLEDHTSFAVGVCQRADRRVAGDFNHWRPTSSRLRTSATGREWPFDPGQQPDLAASARPK